MELKQAQAFIFVCFLPNLHSQMVAHQQKHSKLGESNSESISTIQYGLSFLDYSNLEVAEEALPWDNDNVTLDVIEDTVDNPTWELPKTISSFFEYYQTTQDFISAATSSNSCANDLGAVSNNLSDVNGIWAACQDFLDGCELIGPGRCYPMMTYSALSGIQNELRIVRLAIVLKGLAIVRLFLVGITNTCFDFSLRKDQFSKCIFISVPDQEEVSGEWVHVQTTLSSYDNVGFSSFRLELISRFKGDVILIDKIEATGYCEDGEICETTTEHVTSTSPTRPTTTFRTTTTQHPRTTTATATTPNDEYNTNVTLDTADDIINKSWKLPTPSPRFFEYYNSTEDFQEALLSPKSCSNEFNPEIINLSDVNGIWVACQDLVESCEAVSCYPSMNYLGVVGIGNNLTTVKISLALKGLVIVRLSVALDKCFDFSQRRDPFSRCTFVNTNNFIGENGWSHVQSWISADDNIGFSRFEVQLIPRFKGDVALIDKIEATPFHLCGAENCTTPPIDPTPTEYPTTSPVTTETTKFSVTTVSVPSETTQLSTVSGPTTVSPSPPCSTVLTEVNSSSYTAVNSNPLWEILETSADADKPFWNLPLLFPKWFDYYENFAALDDDVSIPLSCIAPMAEVLPFLGSVPGGIDGLWASCEASGTAGKSIKTPDKANFYPSINYVSNDRIIGISLRFYLNKNAILRLHLGCICYDYSDTADEDSSCEFKKVSPSDEWVKKHWTVSSYQLVKDFQVQLVSGFDPENVIILDKITVTYEKCSDGEGSTVLSTPSTTVPSSLSSSSSTGGTPPSTTESTSSASSDDTEAPSSSWETTSASTTQVTTTSHTSRTSTPATSNGTLLRTILLHDFMQHITIILVLVYEIFIRM